LHLRKIIAGKHEVCDSTTASSLGYTQWRIMDFVKGAVSAKGVRSEEPALR